MKMYTEKKTGAIFTKDEMRKEFHNDAMKDCGFDHMSFDDYLETVVEIGDYAEHEENYLVVGHNCDYRGELDAVVFEKKGKAYDYIDTQFKNDPNVTINPGAGDVRYASEDDYIVYEMSEIGAEPYILVDWSDGGMEPTSFIVTTFDTEDEARRAIIDRMHSLLNINGYEATTVWFGDKGAEIDYDDIFYRWDIIYKRDIER